MAAYFDFSIKWKGERLGILEMRRHYANYFKGIPNFKSIRTKLVTLENTNDILNVLEKVKQEYKMVVS